MTVLELFVCSPLSCSLTRSSCGQRHVAQNGSGKRTVGAKRPDALACRDCPVGAAHARGERPDAWPDGRAIAVALPRPQLAARPTPPPDPPPPPEETEETMPKTYTIDGVTKTLAEWAADLGVTYNALRLRLRNATTDEEVRRALTQRRSDPLGRQVERQHAAALHETVRRAPPATPPPRVMRIEADGAPKAPKAPKDVERELQAMGPPDSVASLTAVVEAMGLTVVHAGLAPNARRLVMVIDLDGGAS